MLNISTLGPLLITLDDKPVHNFKTTKVQALLVYLAVEGERNHSRESLMELLWPDMPLESAQVNLRQTIYRLRQVIPAVENKKGQDKVNVVGADRQVVHLNKDANIHLDIHDFLNFLEKDPQKAVVFYRGDFLSDFFLSDSAPFEQWAEGIRQDLQRKALKALLDLTDHYLAAGDFENAQHYAWRQLEIDNVREIAYRQLMVSLAKSGQRNAALSQFQLCQKRLERELGVSPSQETFELYQKIQAEELSRVKTLSPRKAAIKQEVMPIFLLTDIEGSTKLWDQYHQEMLSALFTHNKILENRIAEHGGRILELRGDGVKAVFEGGDPLSCVIKIQEDFNRIEWGEIGDLRIRMGLHGVSLVRKGYDFFEKNDQYYGPVLNHTARVMDAGWGGQILVSEQVHNACSLPDGAVWIDHGLHMVKSLDNPIHILELTHPDISNRQYPNLRTLSNQTEKISEQDPLRKGNLPEQLTPFIGRKKELKKLHEFLQDGKIRLVTILGSGGIGKTRLAIEVADNFIKTNFDENKASSFPDGIYFVPLAPLSSSDEILATIFNTLNIPTQIPQRTDRGTQIDSNLEESLINFLQNKKILLILDNFEHLLDGVELISNTLRACSTLKILTTSREKLHLQGEQVYPIFGLEYPVLENFEEQRDFAAMELFIQTAKRIKPDFKLNQVEKNQLIDICRLTEGMPLSLELAASWVDVLSIEEILYEVKKSFDFLETDFRDMPIRHRSIRGVFDSSWQLLTPEERKVFPRLSVFRGGFGRDSAQKVTGVTIRELAGLVNKSLVQYNETEGCYQIHELLRQYGDEKLKEAAEEEIAVRNTHSTYYCIEIKNQLDRSLSTGDLQAFTYIKNNISNILEAWSWSVEHNLVDNIDMAIDGICLYYDWNWRNRDGLALCQSAIDALCVNIENLKLEEPAPGTDQYRRILAKVIAYKGLFTFYTNIETAQEILQRSLSIIDTLESKQVSTQKEQSLIYFLLGVAQYQLGSVEISKEYFQKSYNISEDINDEFMGARNLDALGDIARTLGMPREAKEWYERSLQRARLKQNRWGEMKALNNLGWAARHMMEYEKAIQLYKENFALSQEYRNPFEAIRAIESLGFLSIFLGDFKKGIEYFSKAVEISSEYGIQHQAIASKVHIGVSHWLAGNFDSARQMIQAASSLSLSSGPLGQIFPMICKAELSVILGQYDSGQEELIAAKNMTDQFYSDRFTTGRLTRILGWIALAKNEYPEANTHFTKSIHLYQFLTDDEQVAWSQAGLARALIGEGNFEQAKEVLLDALWTVIEIKAFIPLLFILPTTTLLLERENLSLAREVYLSIQNSAFLAKSPFFEDTCYRYLPSQTRGRSHNSVDKSKNNLVDSLWEIASKILSTWMKNWMEEPQMMMSTPHQEESEKNY